MSELEKSINRLEKIDLELKYLEQIDRLWSAIYELQELVYNQ